MYMCTNFLWVNINRSWRSEKPKSKSYFCFAVVFNSMSKKTEDLPVFSLGGTNSRTIYLETHYPENAPELYLGFDLSDRVALPKSTAPIHFLTLSYHILE